ncbi:MAG: hypothetical protein ACXW4B_00100 [Micavibrio sp.]
MVKASVYIGHWWGIFWREAMKPISLLPIAVFLAALLTALRLGGLARMKTELIQSAALLNFSVLAFVMWLILLVAVSVYKTKIEIDNLGSWSGHRFTYNSPQQIRTLIVQPNENGENIRIKIPSTPPRSFVRLKVDYEDGKGYLFPKIHENQARHNLGQTPRDVTHGIRLNDKSEMVVEKCIASNSDTTIATLSVVYWEAK